MSKELVRLLRELKEVSGKLYSNTLQDKDLRVIQRSEKTGRIGRERDIRGRSRGGTAKRRVDVIRGKKSNIPRKLKMFKKIRRAGRNSRLSLVSLTSKNE